MIVDMSQFQDFLRLQLKSLTISMLMFSLLVYL